MRLDAEQIEVLDDEMARFLQIKTPRERLDIANGLWRSARKLISGALIVLHPGWSEAEVSLETSKRLAHGAY